MTQLGSIMIIKIAKPLCIRNKWNTQILTVSSNFCQFIVAARL